MRSREMINLTLMIITFLVTLVGGIGFYRNCKAAFVFAALCFITAWSLALDGQYFLALAWCASAAIWLCNLRQWNMGNRCLNC